MSHNRNPDGKNQYGDVRKFFKFSSRSSQWSNLYCTGIARADDPVLLKALNDYHREKLTNNTTISKRLKADHNIIMGYYSFLTLISTCNTYTLSSPSTVKRRRKELGLVGSGIIAKTLPYAAAEQMVISQMDKDPRKRQGVKTIQNKVAFHDGIHIKRSVMLALFQCTCLLFTEQ